MAISAQDVNKLRKMTGAGMMDCKKALEEAGGDFDKAVEFLRKKGQKVAAKRADRETSEGQVFTTVEGQKGYLLALGCETDFVAKNQDFQDFGKAVLDAAVKGDIASAEELMKADMGGNSVEEKLTDYIGKIGEKIEITSYERVEGDAVQDYIHSNGKLGVLLAFEGVNGSDLSEVAKDISMQIAAMNPIAIDKEGVPQEVIDRELEIGREQAVAEGKPEHIIDKIAQGKLGKYFKEHTLLEQAFVKDSKVAVKKVLADVNKDLKIKDFKRISLG